MKCDFCGDAFVPGVHVCATCQGTHDATCHMCQIKDERISGLEGELTETKENLVVALVLIGNNEARAEKAEAALDAMSKDYFKPTHLSQAEQDAGMDGK